MPLRASNMDSGQSRDCGWQPGFVYGSRTANDTATGALTLHPAAVAYYDSVARLCKQWGIDLVKMDCVFGSE